MSGIAPWPSRPPYWISAPGIVPQAKGYIIVGKLRNQLVPIMIRTGVANPNPTQTARVP